MQYAVCSMQYGPPWLWPPVYVTLAEESKQCSMERPRIDWRPECDSSSNLQLVWCHNLQLFFGLLKVQTMAQGWSVTHHANHLNLNFNHLTFIIKCDFYQTSTVQWRGAKQKNENIITGGMFYYCHYAYKWPGKCLQPPKKWLSCWALHLKNVAHQDWKITKITFRGPIWVPEVSFGGF